MRYRVWFTTRTGLELFHDVEAKDEREAREKAMDELMEKSPNLGLIYRYAWKIEEKRNAV